MTFGAFSIIFRSIFLEGLARPITGVRLLLKQLLTKFRNLGGELRLRTSVQRIVSNKGKVEGVVLADGTELAARNVVSSAGWPETIRLCGEEVAKSRPVGGISICEAIAVLDQAPANLGVDRTIVFFNDSEKFHFERPNEPVDPRSGVACSPNNFAYPEPLRDNMVRVSALANYDRWAGMDEETYQREKALWADRIMASAERFVPEFRKAMIDKDFFTPATIQRFTAHDRGAIYGSTEKRFDGTTHLENLFLCGNDQGLVGIIGAIISGINIVNRYLLKTT
jgi:phytoene dehydrogenase-like protein